MAGYFLMRRDLDAPITAARMPAGLDLIAFTPAIAPDCLDLMIRSYGEIGLPPMGFDEWFSETTKDAEYDPALIWVARDDTAVVGFCHCWTLPFVKDLVVRRDWRRRGVGAALLTLALSAFKARGAASVDLKTDIDNTKAQSLYRRLGFVVVAENA